MVKRLDNGNERLGNNDMHWHVTKFNAKLPIRIRRTPKLNMIFISYASEDQEYAHAIFLSLRAENLDPWMDKPPREFKPEGIQVGQKWERVLKEKLENADYIILILSPRSVNKRGYVQVEFRTALERMSYLPDEGVLVLPILPEHCDVPSLKVGNIELKSLQWDIVDQSETDDFAKNLRARITELIQ